MKQLTLSIALLVFCMSNTLVPLKKAGGANAGNFHLRFVTIGFGSNMFRMQPVFNVDGQKFVYTSEQVWISPGEDKIERDTLLTGSFRTSSIDSISALVREIRDSVIRKADTHVISGSAASIEIETDVKKIKFDLHNTSDSTAEKITAILNTYIPQPLQRLYVSKWSWSNHLKINFQVINPMRILCEGRRITTLPHS
jgi:hypothetical protein